MMLIRSKFKGGLHPTPPLQKKNFHRFLVILLMEVLPTPYMAKKKKVRIIILLKEKGKALDKRANPI
jgi:hypothetical protein